MYNKNILLSLLFIFLSLFFGFDGHAQTPLKNKDTAFIGDRELKDFMFRVKNLFVMTNKLTPLPQTLFVGKPQGFFGEIDIMVLTDEKSRIVCVNFFNKNTPERVRAFYNKEFMGKVYHNRPKEKIYLTVLIKPI